LPIKFWDIETMFIAEMMFIAAVEDGGGGGGRISCSKYFNNVGLLGCYLIVVCQATYVCIII
jgi:hypothetical protein